VGIPAVLGCRAPQHAGHRQLGPGGAGRADRLGLEPYCLISVFALCADDAAAAQWLHGPSRLSALRERTGHPATNCSPEPPRATLVS
jgi:hypothetical protein